jgi:hypothetical protein
VHSELTLARLGFPLSQRPWSNDLADSISDFQKMLQVNTVGTFIVNAHV